MGVVLFEQDFRAHAKPGIVKAPFPRRVGEL